MSPPEHLRAAHAALCTGVGLVDLSGRARFAVTGEDRSRYLNGQITQSLQRAAPGRAIYACLLTAKGKLCGDVFLSATPDRYLLDCEGALRGEMAARLERYIVADDVQVIDCTDQEATLHLLPPIGSEEGARALAATLPLLHEAVACARFGRPGLDLALPRPELPRALAALAPKCVAVPETLAEILRVEAGYARWGAELTPEIIPTEAGLADRAIDFHKGCYIGQETISRLESVGQVTKTLRRILPAEAFSRLEPGWGLWPQDVGESRAAGWITSVAWSFTLDKPLALGYVKSAFAGDGTGLWAAPKDPGESRTPVVVRPLQ